MFKGVNGKGIKQFFQKRRGRDLSLPKKGPTKIQTGYKIEEITKNAIEDGLENLIRTSLEQRIASLEAKYNIEHNEQIKANLEWAREYLAKFNAEVEKIKNATPPVQTEEEKKQLELKTIRGNINIQCKNILERLGKMPYAISGDDFEITKAEIKALEEKVRLYDNSVQSYQTKGGVEEFDKPIFDDERLRKLYKVTAKKIEELKDEITKTPDSVELKEKIQMLEKFAASLSRFAKDDQTWTNIRTEVDQDIAAEFVKKRTNPGTPPLPPQGTDSGKKEYQTLLDKYMAELKGLNTAITQHNNIVAKLEGLLARFGEGNTAIEELIQLTEDLKASHIKINHIRENLVNICSEGKEKHKIDFSKLTCVKEFTVEKIKYTVPYVQYVEILDRQAIELTRKIQELEKEKETATQERINEINLEIQKLFKAIIQINNLVEKRIIHHAKTNKKSSKTLFEARHERKKKIAEEYDLGTLPPLVVATKDKTEEEAFRETITRLTDEWLEALHKAPMNIKGTIDIDETKYKTQLYSLITSLKQTEQIKIIEEGLKHFQIQRTITIKDKKEKTRELVDKIRTRIKLIFQSGTIVDGVTPGVDHNEWLTEIEYSELVLLIGEPEYKDLIPNAADILEQLITEQQKKYKDIKKRQQLDIIEKLSEEFAVLGEKIDAISMDDNFEATVENIFLDMKTRYKKLEKFDIAFDFTTNVIKVTYNARQYNYSNGSYSTEPKEFEHTIMSTKKLEEYKKHKGIVEEPSKKEPQTDEDILSQNAPSLLIAGEDKPKVKVTNRQVKLATSRRTVINRAKATILKGVDSFTLTLLNKGLRIAYTDTLRNQLRELNMRLSLVKKDNYRSRKSIEFNEDVNVQDLAFKTKKEDIDIEGYKLEFRLVEDNKRRSDLLYTYDLQDISKEL